jgi:hypothetical protein
MEASIMRVGKLDAARRQLRTAITLWFNGGDPVSVHTLVFAAYDVLHHLAGKRNPQRAALLFDWEGVKTERLTEWNRHIRKHANFFKHSNRDGDTVVEFNPAVNEGFILFAIRAKNLCGETQDDEESAFLWWQQITKPERLTEKGRKKVAESVPIESIEECRRMPKSEFFERFLDARTTQDRLPPGIRAWRLAPP